MAEEGIFRPDGTRLEAATEGKNDWPARRLGYPETRVSRRRIGRASRNPIRWGPGSFVWPGGPWGLHMRLAARAPHVSQRFIPWEQSAKKHVRTQLSV